MLSHWMWMPVVLVLSSLPGLEDFWLSDWKLPKEDATSQKAMSDMYWQRVVENHGIGIHS
jgi:hypothetical protein